MGSLALRPGDSLAIHMMALSIGSRIFSFLPSCYSSYWALTLTQVGLTSHCSCQPSLDAHLIVSHQYLGADCCGCLFSVDHGEMSDIVCNECEQVIMTVPA